MWEIALASESFDQSGHDDYIGLNFVNSAHFVVKLERFVEPAIADAGIDQAPEHKKRRLDS